ncbi:MAG TPA: nucleotide exchange factor GrpE [Clostridia bacterium]|jgi:molecular chaperone GrpE|nr:MAG: heat shock protein GrpE [Firmicutes bacterium ADurb.Bin146]HOD92826.1 nucleotide exchange factor GrpE [Clostridia bacterium]HQM38976.1 nucleotide exchange factor GrpE [Clostridia bacterium]
MAKSKNESKDFKKQQEGADISDAHKTNQENEQVTECVVDFEKQNQELTDCYKRLAAEYDNYRKRTLKEKEDIYDTCVADITEKFLPVLDNLDLALANSKSAEDDILKGIKMIQKQFIDTLNKLDIKEIDCLNKEFDPNMHDAVMIIEDPDIETGIVVEVFKKGYIYKDRVVRHSMVKVAK